MTPDQKAKDLVEKFSGIEMQRSANISTMGHEAAKECALICVDEIIDSNPEPWIGGNAEWENDYLLFPDNTHVDAKKYWQKVKEQINIL